MDIHSGVSSSEAFTSVRTPDPRIGVSLSGRYSSEISLRGQCRRDVHFPGSITIRRSDEVAHCRFPKPRDADYQAALIYFPLAQPKTAAEHYRRKGQRLVIPQFNAMVGSDPALSHM
jgi:hypothetical protein